jgi:mitochondrial GTPase 1
MNKIITAGHQRAALRQLKDGIQHVDLVVEVRDARIPLSSANPQFEHVLGRRDRILVFNKADLSNHNMNRVSYIYEL